MAHHLHQAVLAGAQLHRLEELHMRLCSQHIFHKVAFCSAALAGILMLYSTPRVFADDCQRQVAKADHDLHEAIEQHGYNSKEAEHERVELHTAREACWSTDHRWWDEDSGAWHTQRDWDDNDHVRLDRDRNRNRDRDRDHDRDRDRDEDHDR